MQVTVDDMEVIHRLHWPSTEELDFSLLKCKQVDSWVWGVFSVEKLVN